MASSKSKANEDIYKRLNAQLMGRLKKAEKELTVVQTSFDKVTVANKKLERAMNTYEHELSTLRESSTSSAKFNDRTVKEFLRLHQVLRYQLGNTRGLMIKLGNAIGSRHVHISPFIHNERAHLGSSSASASASSPSKCETDVDDPFRGCESNIDEFIEVGNLVNDTVKDVLLHLERAGAQKHTITGNHRSACNPGQHANERVHAQAHDLDDGWYLEDCNLNEFVDCVQTELANCQQGLLNVFQYLMDSKLDEASSKRSAHCLPPPSVWWDRLIDLRRSADAGFQWFAQHVGELVEFSSDGEDAGDDVSFGDTFDEVDEDDDVVMVGSTENATVAK